jgi:hypothetical protein
MNLQPWVYILVYGSPSPLFQRQQRKVASYRTPCLISDPYAYVRALNIVFGAKRYGVKAVGQEGVGCIYNCLLHGSGGGTGGNNV